MTPLPSRLTVSLDASDTVATVIRRLMDQAEGQERVTTRYLYRESLLRYLAGAQLELNLGNSVPTLHHELLQYWVWDQDCSALYTVGNTAYVITGTPGEPTVGRLRQLIALGWRPTLISRDDRIEATNDLLAEADLLKSVSAMSVEMFVYSGILRKRGRNAQAIEIGLADLNAMYNHIVRQLHAPDNLLIEMQLSTPENRAQHIEHPEPYAST